MSKNKKKNELINNFDDKLNDSFLKENKIIFKKYKPIKIIGKGAFGKIYSTIRLEDKSVFAMKTEKKNALKKILETEAYFLFLLQGFGIPKLITYGSNKNYYILIETLLGKSLFDIFIRKKKPCDLSNMCLIALQLIERLEYIHSKNIIYRDVKPENFMIGIKDPDIIYIIDFGLCKKYRSSKTGKHILPRYTKKFSGTLKYSSVNVVKGKESSRRDDLISLGYVFIDLLKRNLPWASNFLGLNQKTYNALIKSKESNDEGKLFENIPEELVEYVKYCQNLKFEEDPDYNYLKNFFKKILIKKNYNINEINFCWINPNDNNNRSLNGYTSRKKSNSRIRILQSLENRTFKKAQIDSLDGIKDYKNIKFDKKVNFAFNDFGNLSYNLNNTTNPENNNNKIIEQLELNDSNDKKNYINEGKINKQKIQIKNLFDLRNKIKDSHKGYISLINDDKNKIIRNNKYKNVYIKNNNNIIFNFENPKKILLNNNNENNHRKIYTKKSNNYLSHKIDDEFNKNIYIPNLAYFTNNIKLSTNINTYNNSILNNNSCNNNFNYSKNIKYNPIFSLEKVDNNKYNTIINKSKVYKSKIKREDNEYINENIIKNPEKNSKILKNNKNLKAKKISSQRLLKFSNIY